MASLSTVPTHLLFMLGKVVRYTPRTELKNSKDNFDSSTRSALPSQQPIMSEDWPHLVSWCCCRMFSHLAHLHHFLCNKLRAWSPHPQFVKNQTILLGFFHLSAIGPCQLSTFLTIECLLVGGQLSLSANFLH